MLNQVVLCKEADESQDLGLGELSFFPEFPHAMPFFVFEHGEYSVECRQGSGAPSVCAFYIQGYGINGF